MPRGCPLSDTKCRLSPKAPAPQTLPPHCVCAIFIPHTLIHLFSKYRKNLLLEYFPFTRLGVTLKVSGDLLFLGWGFPAYQAPMVWKGSPAGTCQLLENFHSDITTEGCFFFPNNIFKA